MSRLKFILTRDGWGILVADGEPVVASDDAAAIFHLAISSAAKADDHRLVPFVCP